MEFQPSVLLFLIAPLIVSASLHMVIVRLNLFSKWATPISTQYFGANKTWRGIWAMPILTAASAMGTTCICQLFGAVPLFWPSSLFEVFVLGFFLGLFYVLFELPNSWIKRKIGIPSGKRSHRHSWFFVFIDQADSALGCAILYLIFLHGSAIYFFPLVVIGPVIHLLGNVFLYTLGLRKEPF